MSPAAMLDKNFRVTAAVCRRVLGPHPALAGAPPLPEGVDTTDPNDAFLLAMALGGEADYLVTGDRRAGLLQQGSIGHTRIVTPAVFCAEVL